MIYLFLGHQGSGKTWALGHRLIRRMTELSTHPDPVRGFPPVLIHDERVREGGGWRRDCVGAMAPVKDRFETVDQYRSALQRRGKAPHVATIYGDNPDRLFDLAWGRRLVDGLGTILVIDELDRLPNYLDNKGAIYRCLHHGRPYPIDIFGGARRPENINKAWISEAAELHIFRLSEKNSLASLRGSGVMGVETAINKIPNLPPRRCIVLKG